MLHWNKTSVKLTDGLELDLLLQQTPADCLLPCKQ